MTAEVYLAYLTTVAVFFAAPPGPSQALMIATSLRHGVWRSRWTVAGDLGANVLQMLAAGFGLTALIAGSAEAFTFIKWAGVAYLIYVGIRTFRSAGLTRKDGPGGRDATLARTAFLASAANPKAVFFFAALFPQFIDPGAPIWPQLLILGATYLLVDGVLLFVWGGAARRLLGGVLGRRPALIGRLSGSLMIAAAALLALRRPEAT